MTSTLEIIAEPVKTSIVRRRLVDAPIALVFEVFTKPEHLKRWMGPPSFSMVRCDSDLRVGGRYRYVHRAPNGQEVAFSGEYREITPPRQIVRTFLFEGMPGKPALETLILEEHAGKTLITTNSVHQTVEGRDAHLGNGQMESGMTAGYARLDQLLQDLRLH